MPLINAHVTIPSRARGLMLVGVFIYIHTLCMPAAKVQIGTNAHSPEPSLLADVINTEISYTGPYIFCSDKGIFVVTVVVFLFLLSHLDTHLDFFKKLILKKVSK